MNHSIFAFGIPSTPDMLIIAVLVLVLFGAKKLPLFARSIGRSMGEFKKAKDEFEQEMHRAAEEPPAPTPPAVSAQSPASTPSVVKPANMTTVDV